MTVRILRSLGLAGLAAVLLLAGCSSEEATQPGLGDIAVGIVKAKLRENKVETAGKVKLPPAIPKEQLAKYGKPVILATVPRLGLRNIAIKVARNGQHRTFLAADKSSYTLSGGMLTATRGLPVDLIAQSLSRPTSEIFYAQTYPVTYERSQRHLNGEGKLASQTFACAIAPADQDTTLVLFETEFRVREFTELCKNKTRAFQNSYWLDQSQKLIVQSYQSVSKVVGHVILQVVIP